MPPKKNRPVFQDALAYFRHVYDDLNKNVGKAGKDGKPKTYLDLAAEKFGGKVSINIKKVAVPERWTNLCAVRGSYVLNQTGFKIPYKVEITSSGANGDWHLFRAMDFKAHLRETFGEPDVDKIAVPNDIPVGKKGFLVFTFLKPKDGGPNGHVTLWDGARSCSDKCYFGKDTTAELWVLPDSSEVAGPPAP